MTEQFKVAIIGAGRPLRTEGSTGFGMAHAHTQGYLKTGRCRMVAVADISQENADAFAQKYEIPATYRDYHEMLASEKPDIVSVCTWPHLHAPMVIAAAEAHVRAIHCEKPMSSTWGGARAMAAACQANGVQLTFNHQRRFLEPFQTARRLIRSGEIGSLQRLEAACGDMIDWGTHWLDMLFFYNEETPAQWVIGQIDSREERAVFGLKAENQGICHFKFKNDVRGLLITGFEAGIGCANRIIGSEGVIEVGWAQPWLRIQTNKQAGWKEIPMEEGIHDGVAIDRALANVVGCVATGAEPELSARKALHATEVIFSTYESSRRRGRVDLPLEVDDNPFLTMLEQGLVGPARISA